MRARLLTVGLMLSVATLSGQQPAQPGPEHKRLQFFVGEWKFEGETKGQSGASSKVTGTERCEWFDGRFHVVCRGEATEEGRVTKELTLLGYDPSGVYTRSNIGSSGEGGFATAKLDGKVWRWEGSFPRTDKTGHYRFPWTETSPDSYTALVEMSKDGKTFETVFEGTATRVK